MKDAPSRPRRQASSVPCEGGRPKEDALMSADELLEFLDGSSTDDPADPAFRERLRLELWWLMIRRFSGTDRVATASS